MFKHILVPLDGSRLAEAALPMAAHLGELLGAQTILLHVIESHAPADIHGEHHLATIPEAQEYLHEVAARFFPTNAPVEAHVHPNQVNDVARSLVEHASELDIDLIVLCTHGRSGLRGLMVGSIAQQVLAQGNTPVLLIRPEKSGLAPQFNCQQLLVALDGNPDHEQALAAAADLAKTCGAALHLVMVVPTPGVLPGEQAATATLLPGTTTALLELSRHSGQDYLDNLEASLQSLALRISSEVRRGEPSRIIVKAARQTEADLIVLGTHGKLASDAFWSGSLTPKIVGKAHIPLLLVPVRNPSENG